MLDGATIESQAVGGSGDQSTVQYTNQKWPAKPMTRCTTSGTIRISRKRDLLALTMKIDAIKATEIVRGSPLLDPKAIVGLEKA
jgi:hypothetical protein